MNKNNKKGFMMSEVVIVATIVLVALGALYVSFYKLLSSYKSRATYFDSVSLYLLVYYRDILIENDLMNTVLTDLKKPNNKGIINVYNTTFIGDSSKENDNLFRLPSGDGNYKYNDVVFLIYNDEKAIDSNILNDFDIHQTYKDYVNFLHSSTKLKSNYVMIMERCQKSDENSCKYGYLEIYDGFEVGNVHEK